MKMISRPKTILVSAFFVVANLVSAAAASDIRTDKNLFYNQPVSPEKIDNYLYSLYYSNADKVYNLKGFILAKTPAKVTDLKINPAGHSVAVVTDKNAVIVYDLNKEKRKLGEIKQSFVPTAIGYTADSRQLAVGSNSAVNFYDSRTLAPQSSVSLGITPRILLSHPSSANMVAAEGNRIMVLLSSPIGNGKIIREIILDAPVNSIAFDTSGDKFAAVTTNGVLTIFDGHDYAKISETEVTPGASSLTFHPDSKYIAYSSGGNKITFINLIEKSDTLTLSDLEGGMHFARFLRDGKGTDFIAYTSPTALKYKRITGFAPNFTRMLEDELNARMLEWTKMRPFETEEAYAERVNDETKKKQRQLFANEIATSLAGDLISHADVTLGAYNPESGILTLNVAGLPAVYLTMSQDEATSFGNGEGLEFRNAVYGITADDKFELIYADVYNPVTGKTYTFDNLDRQSLDFLATDDAFISVDLLRQSGREDAKLQDLKEDILARARNSSIISEHTHIDVRADIVSDFDADGKRINNYKVDFTYSVDPEFSSKEDFAPGKYLISESGAAESMLSIVKKAFETDFASYLKPGKRLVITMTGTADALPINGAKPYDGALGEFDSEPCLIDGELSSVSVDRKSGISTNEQLAFLRAQSVRHTLFEGIPALADMSTECNYAIEVSKEKGGAHRRINVSFVFVDAF